MAATPLTIAEFQKHISERYESADRARGTPATWLWFSEEIGELARALARGSDRANLEEEFADVFAWLCTLANINDVDLEAAIRRKYLGKKQPAGHK
jgi:NTP pyrophosphatase (non-canonical NTP hydrolase)